MATYDELRGAFCSDQLRNRLEVAVCVKAHAILQEVAPPAERKTWAADVFSRVPEESERMLRYLLAANKDATIVAVQAADDSTLQAKVDEAIDKLHPVA